MILTVYVDESGTHGAEVMTLAGYTGPAAQWSDFDRRWRKLLTRHGIERLHTKHFMSGWGFEHWKPGDREAFADRIDALMNRHLTCGFSFMLAQGDYRREYRAQPKPDKVHLDSAYGLLFRLMIREVVLLMQRSYPDERTLRLNFVLEEGHRNAGDALRVFAEERRDADLGPSMGTISFARKDCHGGLQLADTLAHLSYRAERDGVVEQIVRKEEIPLQWTVQHTVAQSQSKCPRYRFEVPAAVLRQLRGDLETELERRRSWGAARHRKALD